MRTMDIPSFIDDYNHSMNGVDLVSQYRSSYETHRTTNRNWLAMVFWIHDQAVINAYMIQCVHRKKYSVAVSTHLEFRKELYQQLHSTIHFLRSAREMI